MQLQHVMGARLTLDSGATLMLERLGKGMFHTCYVDRTTSQVYSLTIDREEAQDHSKEILSHPTLGVDPNPYLPPVEYLGDIGERRVYRMPLYQPIRAKEHPEAWAQLRQLQDAREVAWRTVYTREVQSRKMRLVDIGVLVNDMVCQIMDSPATDEELRAALWDLRNSASNYGSCYCFEFARRNCMVDNAGHLILLDVLFSLEASEAITNARVKRAERR